MTNLKVVTVHFVAGFGAHVCGAFWRICLTETGAFVSLMKCYSERTFQLLSEAWLYWGFGELWNRQNILYCKSCSIVHGPWSALKVEATSGIPRNFVRCGEVQQIELRTEDRENGDMGVVAP